MPRVAPPAPRIRMFAPLDGVPQVDNKVPQKADAIRVVATNFALDKGQGIDRAGGVRAFAKMIAELHDFALVRHGNVEALAAGALKLADGGFQLVRRNLQKFVLEFLAGL